VGEVQPVTRSSRNTIFGLIAASLLAASTAHAIPALQLYSPDAIYDVNSQSWIINKSTFELYVIGDVEKVQGTIYDVDLVASVYGSGGSITITPNLAIDSTPEDAAAYDQVIHHAEYANADDHFFYHLGNFDQTNDLIYDYTDPNSSSTEHGQILALTVSVSGYEAVHFDAFDHYLTGGNGNGAQASFQVHSQGVFAPFSHDATDGTPPDAPEPGSMLLVGLGLGAAALSGRRKKS
jgi:PEP-CTERM motif-containing protein